MADAVVVLVEHDVEILIAVEIDRSVAVEIAAPATDTVPEEHADRRTRAIGCGLKRGVVAADRTREADNRIAAEPAASEVVHLEVAGGFVEAEVVEEIVREVEREEERRLGAAGGLQRKIERPLCAVEHARLRF